MSGTKAIGEYVITYPANVYVYVDVDGDDSTVTKVVVDDENLGEPTRVESMDGRYGEKLHELSLTGEEAQEVLAIADDGEWPGWEFGF